MLDIEVRGGLGDLLIYFHESTAWEDLEAMKPDERARVTIISHNPFSDELFKWHPKRDQIEIVKSNRFFLEYESTHARRACGIQTDPPPGRPRRDRKPITMYPSPEDLHVLNQELPREPFIAIAPTSSGMEIENRNIPMAIVIHLCAAARLYRIPVVFLGRTYQGPHAPKADFKPPKGPGIINLFDKLSVPGTAEVIKRADAVVSAHSALLLLSWYHRKPNFLLYPPKYKQHDFDNPSPFGFGKDYVETTRVLFSEFKAQKFFGFLAQNFKRKTRSDTKFLVAIPTLSRADLIIRNKEFLESIKAPDEVMILDNGNQEIGINVPIERSPQNLGVSRSWNLFLRRAFQERDFDGLILLQDDIVWSMKQFLAARRLFLEKSDVDLFLAYHQFSVQVHRAKNIRTIGFYDERFSPGYCEDDDYAMRMVVSKKIYQRFHELDPLPGSQIEGTQKGVSGEDQEKKLIGKWGPKVIRINHQGAPHYESNRNFFLT